MPVALQIRDVPEGVRDAIAALAARRGQSMQAFLLELVEREARTARNASMFERTKNARFTIPDDMRPEKIIREARNAGEVDDDQDPM